jgi:hypothetical protein
MENTASPAAAAAQQLDISCIRLQQQQQVICTGKFHDTYNIIKLLKVIATAHYLIEL